MSAGQEPVKLAVIIIQDYDAPHLIRAMIDQDFRVTQVSTSGGFLRSGNTTLLAGIENNRLGALLKIIKRHCGERVEVVRPTGIADFEEWYPPDQLQVQVGGATVFVLEVERFERV